jgi:hypothetical protein
MRPLPLLLVLLALLALPGAARAGTPGDGIIQVTRSPVASAGSVTGSVTDPDTLEPKDVFSCPPGGTCSASVPPHCHENNDGTCRWSSQLVSLAATAAAGWKFENWACPIGAPQACSVDATAGVHAVTARFSDIEPPHLTLHEPPHPGGSVRGDITISSSAGDNWGIAAYTLTVVAGAQSESIAWNGRSDLTKTVHTLDLPDGSPVLVLATVKDLSDRTATESAGYTVDNHVAGHIASPAGNAAVNAPPRIAVAADPDVSTATCTVDGQTGDCLSGFTPRLSADGDYTVTAHIKDHAGNEADLAPLTFTYDTTPPVVRSALGDGQRLGTHDVDPGMTADDATAVELTCRIDDGPSAPCRPVTLPDGMHTLNATGSDAAGNATRFGPLRLIVDTRPPVVAITSGPPESAILNVPDATFGFAATDDGPVTFSCRLDRGSATACSGPATHALHGLAEGPHTFSLRAVDDVGNAAETTRGFSVNAVHPGVEIVDGPAEGSAGTATAASFRFRVTDSVQTRCSLDSETAYRACSAADGDVLAGLADGPHTFRVSARDAADEVVVAARHWTVDSSRPETRIDSGPADGATLTSGQVTFTFGSNVPGATFRCRLGRTRDAGPFGPCSGPGATHTARGLAPGDYVFAVYAVNGLGTADPTPQERRFRVLRPSAAVASPTWEWRNGTTWLRRLRITGLPADARVTVRCALPGCPFRSRTLKPRRGKVDVAAALKGRGLRPPGRIEVRITAPLMIGTRLASRVPRNALPHTTITCLPPAAKRPQRC